MLRFTQPPLAHLVDELVPLGLDAVLDDGGRRQAVLLVRGQVQLVPPLLGGSGPGLPVVAPVLRGHPVALLSPVLASSSILQFRKYFITWTSIQ